ncbi:MAG TPA: hypothetical protein EYH42_00625 [Sulfurovum sp.]|nr:hypothetical protein [Sulfurovum sp.]
MVLKKSLMALTILSVTTSNIHANDGLEKMFDLMYSGFKYGYSLPKAADYSAAGLARSGNSQKCAKLKYIAENRYCILGVVLKAMDEPKPSRKEILSYDMGKVTELSKMPFTYIGYEHLARTRK